MSIVYQHRRLDNNEIFYVGIAESKKRPYNKASRTQYWKNIVNKADYKVEILVHNCSRNDAIKLEKFFINKYKRKTEGGTLVNLTLGGEGPIGYKKSKLTRKKISESNRVDWSRSNKRYKSILKANGKKVINIKTNEIYNSCKEVSELLNIKYSTLRSQLNGTNKNKTSFKYI